MFCAVVIGFRAPFNSCRAYKPELNDEVDLSLVKVSVLCTAEHLRVVTPSETVLYFRPCRSVSSRCLTQLGTIRNSGSDISRNQNLRQAFVFLSVAGLLSISLILSQIYLLSF